MSLTRRVAEAINRRGTGTAADLLPEMGGCTLRQIVDALHHAKEAGLVSVAAKSQPLGYRSGWTMAVYGPYVPEPAPIGRVASVWELGACFAAQA